MPIAMAMTKTNTPGDSVAKSAIAGPGHQSHQTPADAEQRRAGNERPVDVGRSRPQALRRKDRRVRPDQREADAGDEEARRHHHDQARVPGAVRNAEHVEEAQTFVVCTMWEITRPEPKMKPQSRLASAGMTQPPKT